jgi:uncharacterized alkaline shock family protein YloU
VSLVVSEARGTIAVESVDGVQTRRGRRRIDIEVDEARVRLELNAHYGLVLPDAAREVQKRMADAFVAMCGVGIAIVDVCVEEVE